MAGTVLLQLFDVEAGRLGDASFVSIIIVAVDFVFIGHPIVMFI